MLSVYECNFSDLFVSVLSKISSNAEPNCFRDKNWEGAGEGGG